MSKRSYLFLIVLLADLLLFSCSDSDNCPCSLDTIDPPLSDLSIMWDRGSISANLMPIVLPDPVICQAWLILENRNLSKAFSAVEISSADVILVRNDSILGRIALETNWRGFLAPGKKDTVLFFKNAGAESLFSPPCDEQVFIDFMIQNADGDTRVFRPDTLTFECVF